jgi:hypothetical protein
MFAAILALLILPYVDLARLRGIQFKPSNKVVFFAFVALFLVLMQLGAKHVESPFIEFGQLSTGVYFIYFLVIVLFVNLLENSLILLNKNPYIYATLKNKLSLKFNNSYAAFVFMPFTSLQDGVAQIQGSIAVSILLVILLVSVLSIIAYRSMKQNSIHMYGTSDDDTDSEKDEEGAQDGKGKLGGECGLGGKCGLGGDSEQDGEGKPIQNPVPGRRCPACLERGDTV